MTLNITIINQWGVWQSADHRLTDAISGKLVDDSSIKHVALRCPDGGALITYTGRGRVRSTDVSLWIRQTLRGQTRSVSESLVLLRDRANQELSRWTAGGHHFLTAAAFEEGIPWMSWVTNAQLAPDWMNQPTRDFHLTSSKVDGGRYAVHGVSDAVASEDRAKLERCSKVRPSSPDEYGELLANIIRRAAGHPTLGRYISKSSTTAYMPPEGEPLATKHHDYQGSNWVTPRVYLGIDTTEMGSALLPDYSTDDELQTAVERAGKESVTPKRGFR